MECALLHPSQHNQLAWSGDRHRHEDIHLQLKNAIQENKLLQSETKYLTNAVGEKDKKIDELTQREDSLHRQISRLSKKARENAEIDKVLMEW
ncbi:hypothetical protein HDU91_006916, partial [Kappamyces sp. JEL0680]